MCPSTPATVQDSLAGAARASSSSRSMNARSRSRSRSLIWMYRRSSGITASSLRSKLSIETSSVTMPWVLEHASPPLAANVGPMDLFLMLPSSGLETRCRRTDCRSFARQRAWHEGPPASEHHPTPIQTVGAVLDLQDDGRRLALVDLRRRDGDGAGRK